MKAKNLNEGAKAAIEALGYVRKSTEAAKRAISLMYNYADSEGDRVNEIAEYVANAEVLESYLANLAADFVNGNAEEIAALIRSELA